MQSLLGAVEQALPTCSLDACTLQLADGVAPPPVLAALDAAGAEVCRAELGQRNLEHLFMSLTNRSLRGLTDHADRPDQERTARARRATCTAWRALFLMPVVFIVVMSLALKDVYDPPLARAALTPSTRATPVHAGQVPAASTWAARARRTACRCPPTGPSGCARRARSTCWCCEPGLSDELALPSPPHLRRASDLLTEPGLDGNLFNTLNAELAGAAGELKARAALAQTDATPPRPERLHRWPSCDAERHAGGRPAPDRGAAERAGLAGVRHVLRGRLARRPVRAGAHSAARSARLQSLGVSRTMLLASKAAALPGRERRCRPC